MPGRRSHNSGASEGSAFRRRPLYLRATLYQMAAERKGLSTGAAIAEVEPSCNPEADDDAIDPERDPFHDVYRDDDQEEEAESPPPGWVASTH